MERASSETAEANLGTAGAGSLRSGPATNPDTDASLITGRRAVVGVDAGRHGGLLRVRSLWSGAVRRLHGGLHVRSARRCRRDAVRRLQCGTKKRCGGGAATRVGRSGQLCADSDTSAGRQRCLLGRQRRRRSSRRFTSCGYITRVFQGGANAIKAGLPHLRPPGAPLPSAQKPAWCHGAPPPARHAQEKKRLEAAPLPCWPP